MVFHNIEELDFKSPAAGIKMRLMHGQQMSMIFFTLDQDAPIPEHSHPHEQMGTVISGSIRLTIGGRTRVIHPGQAYHVPPNVNHGGVSLEAGTRVIEAFSPCRDDLK